MSPESYMHRCLQLAELGTGYTAPNPMVGAVLVHGDKIIGEGYHQRYGQAHAEVNCINQAIENGYEALLNQSVLYVSLEPCSHYGKTPPCADLIIAKKIPTVFIGCRDPFNEVNGRGIEKLKAAGIVVEVGILEKQCIALNKRFFTFHTQCRPYVILKWAQTGDGFITSIPNSPPTASGEASEKAHSSRLLISNEYSNRLVHKWRSQEASILVGTNTALLDDPSLTTRLWAGPSPVRLVIDMKLKLPPSLAVFNGEIKTIVFNTITHQEHGNIMYYQITEGVSRIRQILHALYQLKIQSVLVEGGSKLLQSFIDESMWDEGRVITNSSLLINNGLPAPQLINNTKIEQFIVFTDTIEIYQPA
jgi:diaminohydroxyphosphoribosylaminopyrimidine deaminase/5-amino-6-(5-phosphoribosylamino)uracil reductase